MEYMFAQKLLNWYETNKRSLPWRDDPQPYHVLVSEIMAQQTRIAQLLPFYARFMTRFPTIEALAAAEAEGVLAEWAGMGYYARARNLHRTAQIIVHENGGAWPQTRAEWEAMPGVGAYTAGAVMSIAFGKPEAAVDGNVLRVYARVAGDDVDLRTQQAQAVAAAGAFVKMHLPTDGEQIRRYTQALMELGSLVCTPKNPACQACPLAFTCVAYQTNRTAELPVKSPKPSPVPLTLTVLLIINARNETLMRKRTEGLLRGMWVYYLLDGEYSPEEITTHLRAQGFLPSNGSENGTFGLTPLPAATHTFTHRTWHMQGYAAYVANPTPPAANEGGYQFISIAALGILPLPAAMKVYTACRLKF